MSGRQHGDRARYVWGPDDDDQPGRPCRCDDCTAASSAYERNRERQVLYGRWQPYVDAAAAREHLRELAANGIGWRRAAILAGVGNGTISKILYGGPGDRPPTKRIRPDTEAKILGVLPSTDQVYLADTGREPDQSDRDLYRLLARKHHPDVGGDGEMWHRLEAAARFLNVGAKEIGQ